MKKITLSILFGFFSLIAFAQLKTPEWVPNATIYEVNIRQFTPEGTFGAFEKHLPRLKSMGVDILWLMPIHPIGELNRKGSLGSYYAVRDYRGINPEFGTHEDFAHLVDAAHNLGMKVIIDWVANHTSPDALWIEEGKLDWYTLDSLGKVQPTIGTDWWDVADLNYDNPAMRKEMIACMEYWVRDFNIDGYRCDVAGWVPMDFWNTARAALDQIKPVFMLAEAEGKELYSAFEMTYGWEFHHILNDVAKGKKNAADVQAYFERMQLPTGAFHMNFTSNHDENSWNGTEMERMGDARFAMAVMAATIQGMPLVYNGQETSLDRRLKFFDKDSINWDKMDLVDFYTRLLHLHQTNPALFVGAKQTAPKFLSTKEQKDLLIYTREQGDSKVLVVINLSEQAKKVTLSAAAAGTYTNLFTNKKEILKGKQVLTLAPWGYAVYVR
ncbi:MAG: alpha-glucosidase C-terminal domain-containing protein [Crocinitomicaceae bacterium]|jgi:glycosidase|nr:alpha-glucosidase C-terminal domain-containing protein [Crocinitomicaceae bacterium]